MCRPRFWVHESCTQTCSVAAGSAPGDESLGHASADAFRVLWQPQDVAGQTGPRREQTAPADHVLPQCPQPCTYRVRAGTLLQVTGEGMASQTPSLLPYGNSLHYQRCGCPPDWKRGTRAADVVDLLLHKAVQAFQQNKLLPTRHLRVAYMLPHHNVTGDSLLEVAAHAVRRLRNCSVAQVA